MKMKMKIKMKMIYFSRMYYGLEVLLILFYSMSVAILPCYNQYQVPYGTWYSNPGLKRLP